jgi:MOSC domain-containing protein YiiM
MKLLSIHVGQPQTLHIPDPNARSKNNSKNNQGKDHAWVSGIFKSAVTGLVAVGTTNLAGDGQGDTKNHGGPDKAICVYASEHYAHWQQHWGLADFTFGAFGENFTTSGLVESEVCIGDSFAIGGEGEAEPVIVQLSQARQPCWKLARRWQVADMVEQVQDTGYTGWYFRVLQEGKVQAGDAIRLLERPYPHLTLAEANRVMHHDKEDWDAIEALLRCPLLSASWQNALRRRINLHAPREVADRIYGRTAS